MGGRTDIVEITSQASLRSESTLRLSAREQRDDLLLNPSAHAVGDRGIEILQTLDQRPDGLPETVFVRLDRDAPDRVRPLEKPDHGMPGFVIRGAFALAGHGLASSFTGWLPRFHCCCAFRRTRVRTYRPTFALIVRWSTTATVTWETETPRRFCTRCAVSRRLRPFARSRLI